MPGQRIPHLRVQTCSSGTEQAMQHALCGKAWVLRPGSPLSMPRAQHTAAGPTQQSSQKLPFQRCVRSFLGTKISLSFLRCVCFPWPSPPTSQGKWDPGWASLAKGMSSPHMAPWPWMGPILSHLHWRIELCETWGSLSAMKLLVVWRWHLRLQQSLGTHVWRDLLGGKVREC